METELDFFEKKLMQMLLQGEDDTLSILREQLANSTIKDREVTGVGFYISFQVANNTLRTHKQAFAFGDVIADINELEFGAGFLLFVNNGVLSTLEGYAHDGPWLYEKVTDFQLSYSTPTGKRDIEALKKIWQ
ncbi:hypothetical protein [Candidatus Albibeggiatoa sp. nov. BB20]|uniref:hypothetical protein n=1 Tax=Candidatus Albibeggiatoa sp. nov. BB20 TaxID=3162723 RepID=UPI003365311A